MEIIAVQVSKWSFQVADKRLSNNQGSTVLQVMVEIVDSLMEIVASTHFPGWMVQVSIQGRVDWILEEAQGTGKITRETLWRYRRRK